MIDVDISVQTMSYIGLCKLLCLIQFVDLPKHRGVVSRYLWFCPSYFPPLKQMTELIPTNYRSFN